MGLSAEYVIAEFRANNELGRKTGDLANSNRALENLARILGLYQDKVSQDTKIEIIVTRNVPALPPPRCEEDEMLDADFSIPGALMPPTS
jgi:hypothetical protein